MARSLGDSFLNVFAGVSVGAEEEALQRALESLQRPPPFVPSPHTIWISRRAELQLDVDIPSQVTLAFAPSARLVLAGRCVLSIRGRLDAGHEAHFEVLDDARVDLLGPIDEIVADWWTSGSAVSPVARALDALWTRYERNLPPVPILLGSTYALTDTLRIKPRTDDAGRFEVVLRGRHLGALDPPTFVPGPLTHDLAALLSVEQGVVLSMDHVAIELGDLDDTMRTGRARAFRVAACMSFEGRFHGSRVEACSFRFDERAIQANPLGQAARELLAASASPGSLGFGVVVGLLALGVEAVGRAHQRPARLEVNRCLFTGTRAAACALQVDFGAPTALTVRDCQFDGLYGHAVSILSGELSVTACGFANTASGSAPPAEVADVVVRAMEGHADIYGGTPLENAQLTITHCVSTSPAFLVMEQAFSHRDAIRGGATLLGVRHVPADPAARTSVVVGPGAPVRAVLLEGCRFGGSVHCDATNPLGTIVELGTVFVPRADGGNVGFWSGTFAVAPGAGPTVNLQSGR